jgi:type I restriction enzyme S subunit
VYYNRKIALGIDFMEATAEPHQVRRLGLRAGDVLITKDSETADDIAVPAYVVEDLPEVVLGYHLALLRATKVRGDFLYWALRSRRCRDSFSLAASGVTRVGLRQDAMGRVPIPNIPIQQQEVLVADLEKYATGLDGLEASIKRQIELLRERRQALITAAVTGELDIPGVVA